MSVHQCAYVCPATKSYFNFSEIWHVEVDEWCTPVCTMTRSKVKVTNPLKLENLPFSKTISSAIYTGSWQLTT